MPLDKYYLNLAGEYSVCAELLKRGIFATITYGNKKGADIYAIGENRRAAVIEVKASNSNRFVTGFYQKYTDESAPHPAFWVLYSIKPDGLGFHERFFILTHAEMAQAQAVRNGHEALSYAERVRRLAKGVDNVLAGDIDAHGEAWPKIVTWCSSAT